MRVSLPELQNEAARSSTNLTQQCDIAQVRVDLLIGKVDQE